MKSKRLTASLAILFIAFLFISAKNETITVKGKVIDDSGQPLAGCAVVEEIRKGNVAVNGVSTDDKGNYTLQTEKGKTLVFSLIGYKQQKIQVKDTVLNVILLEEEQALDEVTVVAFGVQDRESVMASMPRRIQIYPVQPDSEEYSPIDENGFKFAVESPLSTFSIDVDAASYSNVRRYINRGELPPADAVRTEELVNYFSYSYAQPTGDDPVKIAVETGKCPWNAKHRLVRIGLKAKEISNDNLPASNLVFLIDVSGSMYGAMRLGLVKSSLKLLTNNLRENDRVAIVVYAGSAGEVLPSTSGNDKQKIRDALDKLEAGGSTAGGAGIRLAYDIAAKNFIKDGNNRIILCTDGDFNVGISSKEDLESLIEKERKSGIFLTILGYGMGNYKDAKMQTLAEKGNGNHAYIDNLQEANKVLVSEFGGTIHAVAKDVKLQIEFNPEHVQAYRLIGYESRLLNDKDFNDDTKDAGEIGAGHNVTAFYEIVPTGIKFSGAGSIDPLKYQKNKTNDEKTALTGSKELLTVKLRYKKPDGDTSKKIELAVIDDKSDNVSTDFRFASAVAMFGQLLTNSDFKGDADFDKVIDLAKSALENDEQGYRREFVRIAETAKGLSK
ncbi:MAG: von Willebrand factor type A domain-containing protein [Prevotellaceae bacterium]|jgi:Ca-activated chloride channel family protein|nr:von Willebrand factor type A domain-containing protein [Prevotellaceae bacterium]